MSALDLAAANQKELCIASAIIHSCIRFIVLVLGHLIQLGSTPGCQSDLDGIPPELRASSGEDRQPARGSVATTARGTDWHVEEEVQGLQGLLDDVITSTIPSRMGATAARG